MSIYDVLGCALDVKIVKETDDFYQCMVNEVDPISVYKKTLPSLGTMTIERVAIYSWLETRIKKLY